VEPGLEAQGDARLLESVMDNLLANAWKYTARTPDAHIRFYREGGDFCVADNGAGFDPRYAEKLFQPFQRLHRQEDFPGIGIGLATVQRIVQRHGGEITATGTPGQGAVFRFSLGTTPPGRH
jgi:signal transduction histidine kinase